MIDCLCCPEEEGEKGTEGSEAQKRGEGEGTEKKGQKAPEGIPSDLGLLHQVSG